MSEIVLDRSERDTVKMRKRGMIFYLTGTQLIGKKETRIETYECAQLRKFKYGTRLRKWNVRQ